MAGRLVGRAGPRQPRRRPPPGPQEAGGHHHRQRPSGLSQAAWAIRRVRPPSRQRLARRQADPLDR
eukprot:3744896-Lingulodinium_polyedra.AAC.1